MNSGSSARAFGDFNIHRALFSWKKRFPEKRERIEALRGELADCRRIAVVKTRRGQIPREYPRTEINIVRMLQVIESSAEGQRS